MNHSLPPGTHQHHIEECFGDEQEPDRQDRIEMERADQWQDRQVDREADEAATPSNEAREAAIRCTTFSAVVYAQPSKYTELAQGVIQDVLTRATEALQTRIKELERETITLSGDLQMQSRLRQLAETKHDQLNQQLAAMEGRITQPEP